MREIDEYMEDFVVNWNRVLHALYPGAPEGTLIEPALLADKAEALVRERDELRAVVNRLRDMGVIE